MNEGVVMTEVVVIVPVGTETGCVNIEQKTCYKLKEREGDKDRDWADLNCGPVQKRPESAVIFLSVYVTAYMACVIYCIRLWVSDCQLHSGRRYFFLLWLVCH